MANLTVVEPSQYFAKELTVMRKSCYYSWICISVFGLASNTINVIVFTKVGLKDNVTITLLFLSLSDLAHVLLNCPIVAARVIMEEFPAYPWPLDPRVLILGAYLHGYLFYDYSAFVSVFLAVMRCLCVAKPLMFKSMVTKGRTLVILIALLLVAVILRIPMFTVFRFGWRKNPRTNSSFISLIISSDYSKIHKANDIVNRTVISWLAYTTVIVCVIVLVIKLRKASKFRQSLVNRSGDLTTNRDDLKDLSYLDDSVSASQAPKRLHQKRQRASTSKMSATDLQVIRSVTLICVIFILSQLPFQVISVYRLIKPEFDTRGRLSHLYNLASLVIKTCGLLNASINIFVYIGFNSKYRTTFLRLFLCE